MFTQAASAGGGEGGGGKYDSVDMVEFSIVGPEIAAKLRLVLFLIYSCFVCVYFVLHWSEVNVKLTTT